MARKGQFKLLQLEVQEDKSLKFIPVPAKRVLASTQDAIAYLKETDGIVGKIFIVDVKANVEVAPEVVKKNVVKVSGATDNSKPKKAKAKAAAAPAQPPQQAPAATDASAGL